MCRVLFCQWFAHCRFNGSGCATKNEPQESVKSKRLGAFSMPLCTGFPGKPPCSAPRVANLTAAPTGIGCRCEHGSEKSLKTEQKGHVHADALCVSLRTGALSIFRSPNRTHWRAQQAGVLLPGMGIGQPPPSSQTSKHPGAYGGALADFGHNPGTIRLTRGQSIRYNRAGPHADGRAIRSTFGVSAGNGTAFASPRQRQRVHLPDRPPFASDRIMGRSFAAATRFSTEPMDAAPRMGIGFHGRAGE